MKRLFYDRINADPTAGTVYDLRDYQDDKTVLTNPHKGWYWHYIDGGFSHDSYRNDYETVHRDENGRVTSIDINDDVADFPHLHHIYLRFNWGDIEKEEGKLDWSYIDAIMDAWAKKGKRFALRVCTFQGDLSNATPAWVWEAGASYINFEVDGNVCPEPVYDDPVYLEKLGNFMRQYGEKFNGHPLVEYVDIGTFGVWGEANASHLYPTETIRAHLDLHIRNFPDTPIMFNDDFVPNRSGREIVPGESQELLDYAREQGLCVRDDSIMYAPYIENGYDSLLVPTVYDALYENGPVDTEFCHVWYYTNPQNDEQAERTLLDGGFRPLAALQRGRVTFAGFHGYPRTFLQYAEPLAYYAANRLGYWYFAETMQIPDLKAGTCAEVRFTLSNRGFARCYTHYQFRWRLVAADGTETVLPCDGVDNRTWTPVYVASLDQCTVQTVPLDLTTVAAGTYELQFGLFEGDRAIQWGMDPKRCHDGYYAVTDITISD